MFHQMLTEEHETTIDNLISIQFQKKNKKQWKPSKLFSISANRSWAEMKH